jgi:hypothetical protein
MIEIHLAQNYLSSFDKNLFSHMIIAVAAN